MRAHRLEHDCDPGPVQIQARRIHLDASEAPLHWIPGHPVASHFANLLNVVLPPIERWFVAVFNEALPLVKDPKLADDMRGFIGQEATHADVHDRVLHDLMMARGIDPQPLLDQIDFIFSRTLSPRPGLDPTRRLSHLCDRLWLIAAIEHYTAVLGDFVLNCSWDDHGADPAIADLFRWHGSEEVEHRNVAHDVAVYFHDSYPDRIRSMMIAVAMVFVFFQRGTWYLMKADPDLDIGWWKSQRLRAQDSKQGLLPTFRKLFGSNTFMYFRPGFSPDEMGSTAQAVAYLASSPAARAAHL